MIELIEFEEEKHYDMLQSWWVAHGWQGVHPSVLKPVAYIAKQDGEPVCFAVLWPVTEAGICLMEWIVSNPEAKPMAVIRGIRTISKFYEELARENDYGMIFTTCRQEGLAKVHERNGFERCDEGMIHLAKTID